MSLLSKRDTRVIVERLGGVFASDLTPRTTIVVTDDDLGEVPPHVHRVLSENELCVSRLPDLETLRTRYYSARDLRGMYRSCATTIAVSRKMGFGAADGRPYSFQDLHVVKHAAGELERGESLSTVLRLLASEQRGQLAFDFQPSRSERPPARVVSLPATPPAEMTLFPETRSQQIAAANQALAAKYFLEGAEQDDGEERDLDAAAGSYRRAVLFDPFLVPAIVNLANIHYERDELVEAEALYEKAIRVDVDCFEAYFNIGNIHHDLARYAEAVTAYRDALAINRATLKRTSIWRSRWRNSAGRWRPGGIGARTVRSRRTGNSPIWRGSSQNEDLEQAQALSKIVAL